MMKTKMMAFILMSCILLSIIENMDADSRFIGFLKFATKLGKKLECCIEIKCYPPDLCSVVVSAIKEFCKCIRSQSHDE